MSLPNGVDVSQLVQHPVLAALPPFFLRASERYQVSFHITTFFWSWKCFMSPLLSKIVFINFFLNLMPHLYSVLNKWFDVKIIWLGALIIQNNKHVVFKMILLKKVGMVTLAFISHIKYKLLKLFATSLMNSKFIIFLRHNFNVFSIFCQFIKEKDSCISIRLVKRRRTAPPGAGSKQDIN